MNQQMQHQLFYEMLRIRKIEESFAEKYPQQEMRCPMHLSIGQEAPAVGVCSALLKSDCIMSSHRAHAHYLAKGGNLNRMVAEIYGKKDGCCAGLGGSMHLVDLSVNMLGSTPIVGGTFPVAIGVAYANAFKKNGSITVVFFGDGMTEEGVFCEGINFASLKNLPILFVCENNFYSVYSPLSVRQSEKRNLCEIVRSHGIEAHLGNGNDVEEVFSLATNAIKKIRENKGPIFLELMTYRWKEHCGPNEDDDLGYRSKKDVSLWKKRCPIDTYRQKLFQENLLDEHLETKWQKQIQNEIENAYLFAQKSSFASENLIV